MTACKNGHVSVVQYLLENRPSLLNMQCQVSVLSYYIAISSYVVFFVCSFVFAFVDLEPSDLISLYSCKLQLPTNFS